jgi:hypothetical protein
MPPAGSAPFPVLRACSSLALALAVVFAIPAMHDSNIERWMRGDCTLQPGGRMASFRCPPQTSQAIK